MAAAFIVTASQNKSPDSRRTTDSVEISSLFGYAGSGRNIIRLMLWGDHAAQTSLRCYRESDCI